jgi:hypothetical protein
LFHFKDIRALDSILVILDNRGFDFFNIDPAELHAHRRGKFGLHTDSAAHAIFRLNTGLITANLSPL